MNDEHPESSAARSAKSGGSQADFFAGLVIGLISLYTLVESINMPYYEEGKRGFFSSPGFTPGLLSLGLLIMAVVLMLRARGFRPSLSGMALSVERWRVLGVLSILIAYVALIRPIGYPAATFLMLAVFQFVFMAKRNVTNILVFVIGLSAAVTGGLYLLFGKVFLIPIP